MLKKVYGYQRMRKLSLVCENITDVSRICRGQTSCTTLKDHDAVVLCSVVLRAPRPALPRTDQDLTMKEPRSRDSRFLHTGRRISMQLKLSTAAGALAQAKADWKNKTKHGCSY